MAAHNSILEARVKQTRNANRKCQYEPFKENDLVYYSTKNLTFDKGLARKLIPKYIGPYKIIKDFGNHSFRIDLPANFTSRGVHPVFHSSLLRIHVPNDDRRFPGRLDSQLNESQVVEPQWKIERILSHCGYQKHAVFQVLWSTGDETWMPFFEIEKLPCLQEYLELLEIESIDQLPNGQGNAPEEVKLELGIAAIDFLESTHQITSPDIREPDSQNAPHPQLEEMSLTDAMNASNAMDDDVGNAPNATPGSDTLSVLPENVYIDRVSPDAFTVGADDGDDDTIYFPAQLIPADYRGFVDVFNATTDSIYRFAYYEKDSDGTRTIANIDYKGPPMSLFGVKPYQCFKQGACVRPDHVEYPIAKLNRLQDIALQYAKVTSNGRKKFERARQERLDAQEAARKIGAGGYHFMAKKTFNGAGPSKRARYA
ncbi:hypothetical protein FB446DRAFT_788707 [Lentinula raphanica]|nr:hypothetical protein FB446DRAFT_788707 [Lentinula raphanica]